MIKKEDRQKGVVLIMSVLLAGVLLSIVFVLSAIFIPKIRIASETRNSVTAAYAAESALEWCLYGIRIGVIDPPVMLDEEITYRISGSCDDDMSPIKATGTYRGVTRAFEINF